MYAAFTPCCKMSRTYSMESAQHDTVPIVKKMACPSHPLYVSP